MWIVRTALDRPYTFVVLALLILILSPLVILATPTDIFPNINIPAVAVGFTYTGLSPEEMEGRITTVYERSLTTLVDNIQHIESTSYDGLAIVKIYLQPNSSIDTANAQVTAASQMMLRQSAARNPAAACRQLQRFQRSDSSTRPFWAGNVGATAQRSRSQLLANAVSDRSGFGHPVSLRWQAAAGNDQSQPVAASVERTVAI
jgi:multidrug efflux pump subunit AcrB